MIRLCLQGKVDVAGHCEEACENACAHREIDSETKNLELGFHAETRSIIVFSDFNILMSGKGIV